MPRSRRQSIGIRRGRGAKAACPKYIPCPGNKSYQGRGPDHQRRNQSGAVKPQGHSPDSIKPVIMPTPITTVSNAAHIRATLNQEKAPRRIRHADSERRRSAISFGGEE